MLSPFLDSDIGHFLAAATSEGWICGKWEMEFLLQTFPQGCLVKRADSELQGYITSLRHDKSGWIGNLLVAPESRRGGIGTELMQGALQALLDAGVETVWLTASAKGVELYKKLGFIPVDSINRWVGEGGGGRSWSPAAPCDTEMIRHVDSAGWGDRRDALLAVTGNRGHVICGNHSFVCIQHWEQGTQLGPWGTLFEGHAAALLESALAAAGTNVFLDVPAGNLMAAALLTRKGFSIRGSNTLMYLGAKPKYSPHKVFALASMGSMG
ncbi:GNAT family N-acetyltransferase [Geomonas sp. Red69]|uniref:GNAT family N-acetyltransferase n=1 Tax=Geomonas diazotrophica TaxID=2843197 RepID=A0ABX8JNM7_9BACT|nr:MULTISPECIES: GNAT family N-acetyltransferase [Geomonas]MBU5637567.1 GNAT family N-acetyltransferase [Geomonas diazotrophica]QWV99313.1 GNAT family N-acetyltransferase [Geomonas nitrogeniifigens]QXE88480.1 GNAT family N-acetyltransferase [Geomonas nitrogeniifigens]